jgi:hypothetical protein
MSKVYTGLIVDLKEQQMWAGSGAVTSKNNRWTSPSGADNKTQRNQSNARIQRRESELDRDQSVGRRRGKQQNGKEIAKAFADEIPTPFTNGKRLLKR